MSAWHCGPTDLPRQSPCLLAVDDSVAAIRLGAIPLAPPATWDGYHGRGTKIPCEAAGSIYDVFCRRRAHRHGSRNAVSIPS